VNVIRNSTHVTPLIDFSHVERHASKKLALAANSDTTAATV